MSASDELSNKERERQANCAHADRNVVLAMEKLGEARLMLSRSAEGTGAILIRLAIDKLNAALGHLPKL